MKIQFITSNPAKVAMAQQRLTKYGLEVVQKPLELNEARSFDVLEVALDKAKQAMKLTNEPFLIEDSAFYVESLNGFPGTFIKFAFDTLGETRITEIMKNETDKTVTAKSVLVYGDPKTGEIKQFVGLFEGEIPSEPRGEHMRGWKVVRIFVPKGWQKTLAEMDDGEWDRFLEEFREGDHFEQFGQWAQAALVK